MSCSDYKDRLGYLGQQAAELDDLVKSLIVRIAEARKIDDSASLDLLLPELDKLLIIMRSIKASVTQTDGLIDHTCDAIVEGTTVAWLMVCGPIRKDIFRLQRPRQGFFQRSEDGLNFQGVPIRQFMSAVRALPSTVVDGSRIRLFFGEELVALSLGRTSRLNRDDEPSIYFGLFVDRATAEAFIYPNE